ncbi:glycerol dehydrogenase [Skermanella sp. TT6]|uniref:Glycerol dehydrogenase n=1 Tax=Skermanella cutis TaxID=2775420 RepID=A0ABX7BB44_9PROT|nr:glycerol dehydrogenase [Skermanella sp. TT6]QQP91343.1 glycerol dehydrogenase [Skermanella sp. TT6]
MIIFGSPGRYIQGPGTLDRIGEEVGRLGKSAVLVADAVVDGLVGGRVAAGCDAAGVTLRKLAFGGEITPGEIDRLHGALGGERPEVVIAAGGGKCIDAGKGLAARLGAEVASLPTVASNDAPTSHVYVLYDEDHRLLRVDRLPRNPALVLVDTAVIVRAPRILFLAGIGDALVKSFEAAQCALSGGRNIFGSRPPQVGLVLADACYRCLRDHAAPALAAVDRGEPDEAVERVVEATVLWSGLAFENGGLSIVHSMTRGLSAVPALAGSLHGLQVAYALLVQCLLEERDPAFMDDLLAFYRGTGLPCGLADLGLEAPSDADYALIAELTLQAPHARNFDRDTAPGDLVRAMRFLDGRAGTLPRP